MKACFNLAAALSLLLTLSLDAQGEFPPLPVHQAAGSNYQVSLSIGRTFRGEIMRAMENNAFFNNKLLPYNKTQDGATLYEKYLHTAESTYPQYVEEIQGMADGAKIGFDELFLWNMQFEYEMLLRPSTQSLPLPPAACSDLYLLEGASQALMGHNEDGGKEDIVTGYMVNASLSSGDRFLAYCYAGQLCGKAFGYNFATRTVITSNALFPRVINTSAIGRNFLNRALLSLPYSEIVKTVKQKDLFCSSGFSVNVGWKDTQNSGGFAVSNFELSLEGAVETQYKSGYDYHFNMYLHSPQVSQYEDPSSEHRLARIKELPQAKNMTDILSYLGDTKDPQYPIYRTATPPDGAATVATALFDLKSAKFYVFRGNPSSTPPVLTVPLN